jgi:hypothetical protein
MSMEAASYLTFPILFQVNVSPVAVAKVSRLHAVQKLPDHP